MVKIFKFGGASVRDAKSIWKLGEIVAEYSSDQLVVVISASNYNSEFDSSSDYILFSTIIPQLVP